MPRTLIPEANESHISSISRLRALPEHSANVLQVTSTVVGQQAEVWIATEKSGDYAALIYKRDTRIEHPHWLG